jgi:hypothetical protein
MGIGYAANLEIVIENDSLRKIVPKEYDKLIKLLEVHNCTIEQLAMYECELDYLPECLDKDAYNEVFAAYDELVFEFESKTKIKLYLKYHDSTRYGDRYDDVDGAFFALSWKDAVCFTKEAQELVENGSKIAFKGYVTFG